MQLFGETHATWPESKNIFLFLRRYCRFLCSVTGFFPTFETRRVVTTSLPARPAIADARTGRSWREKSREVNFHCASRLWRYFSQNGTLVLSFLLIVIFASVGIPFFDHKYVHSIVLVCSRLIHPYIATETYLMN